MVGLAVLALIVGYVALWSFVFTKARNRAEKIAAVVIALVIPFWDLPFGYYAFSRSCSAEGGLHTNDRIAAQRSICVEYAYNDLAQALLKRGFETVELPERQGIKQFKLSFDGRLETSNSSRLTSKYCIALATVQHLPLKVDRREFVVRDVVSGHIAARYTSFSWYPGWWRPRSLPSEGQTCHQLRADDLITLLWTGSR